LPRSWRLCILIDLGRGVQPRIHILHRRFGSQETGLRQQRSPLLGKPVEASGKIALSTVVGEHPLFDDTVLDQDLEMLADRALTLTWIHVAEFLERGQLLRMRQDILD
jgi:hypothetical protein